MDNKYKYKYKVCVSNLILLIGTVQICRILVNKILLSQLNLNILNMQIINMISCMILCISLSLILKNNELYSPMGKKLISIINSKKSLQKNILLCISSILIAINPYFNGGYILSNLVPLITSTIIIPILEELLFREYIWNYFRNYIKNGFKIFITVTVLYAIYSIGYIDTTSTYLSLLNKSEYTINFMFYKFVNYIILGSILGFIKMKFKDTQICILIHSIINVLNM